jgi:hypothetical protein
MRKTAVTAFAALAFVVIARTEAQPFPLELSAVGGIGFGYYSMSDLNRHIGSKRQQLGRISLDELSNGLNFRLEGRLWLYGIAAATGGYEYFWGETSSSGTSTSLTYRTPADVYTIGVIAPAIKIGRAFDICVGLNWCTANAVFEMKEETDRSRFIPSFKGDNSGYEAYVEAHTRFINPIEIGFQLGYRGLKIKSFTSTRTGQEAFFSEGQKIQIDYSGVFFMLTAAVRI